MVFLNKVASGDEIPDLNLAALHLAMPLLDVRPVRSRPVPFVARQLNKYVIAAADCGILGRPCITAVLAVVSLPQQDLTTVFLRKRGRGRL